MADKDKSDSAPLGLDEAYSVKTPDDNRRLYAKWAATYELSFVEATQYRYPKAISELFHTHLPNQASEISQVIDTGCGTGLTGMYLSRHRPDLLIDGLDISPEMLAQAGEKMRSDGRRVYRNLDECDLTQKITSSHGPYDALICSGTFTHGHLGPETLANLVPLLRTGGYLAIGVNNEHFISRDFQSEIDRLQRERKITQPEILRIDVYEEGSPHFGDQARVIVGRTL